MLSLEKMLDNFSEGLYTMWAINFVVAIYCVYVVSQFGKFLRTHMKKFGSDKVISGRLVQAVSGLFLASMLLFADVWAMFYYTMHPLSSLEFFFYAFDLAVLRHLSEEARRFSDLTPQ